MHFFVIVSKISTYFFSFYYNSYAQSAKCLANDVFPTNLGTRVEVIR